jgi:hypothetical protein
MMRRLLSLNRVFYINRSRIDRLQHRLISYPVSQTVNSPPQASVQNDKKEIQLNQILSDLESCYRDSDTRGFIDYFKKLPENVTRMSPHLLHPLMVMIEQQIEVFSPTEIAELLKVMRRTGFIAKNYNHRMLIGQLIEKYFAHDHDQLTPQSLDELFYG